ncbi:MAG: DUF3224 domain-containing protein [Deltaproteobacteria bacterium]|nr:DUF3224 domain-containing protein [Deltaproteobacteria bacterium]
MLHATFILDAFDQEEPYDDVDGVAFARAHVKKTFSGDVKGTGKVEMLSTRTQGGAGYVALERLTVELLGRSGSFALLHAGTMIPPRKTNSDVGEAVSSDDAGAIENKEKPTLWATWPIVPGSGTGALEGIQGSGSIEIDDDGMHHFYLDCTFTEK